MRSTIEASDLGKTFATKAGPVNAVQGVSFKVAAGEVVGLLGPNGAGKTTTMRMLSTLEQPSTGHASVTGHDLRRDPRGVREAIGLVAQSGGTRPIATARDEWLLHARLHRLASPETQCRTRIDMCDLAELADRQTATLSGGQRRRLDLAIGLIHAPSVIFLDEPTAALDPPSRNDLWKHVRALRDRTGATVMLSTHHLDEADALCDRVLILDRGKLIAEDSPTHLKQQLGHDIITVDIGALPDIDGARARDILAALPGVQSVHAQGDEVRVGCRRAEALVSRIVLALHDADVQVRGLQVTSPSLDDVFLTLTGHATQEL